MSRWWLFTDMGGNYDRELKRLLRENGCYFVRQGAGSHEIWYSPLTERHITVPTNCCMRHTANGIMKQAGVAHRF